MIPATQRPEDCKPSRPEWVLVLLTILLGFALRFAMPSRMSLELFDDGVFASPLWFMDAYATQYPDRFP